MDLNRPLSIFIVQFKTTEAMYSLIPLVIHLAGKRTIFKVNIKFIDTSTNRNILLINVEYPQLITVMAVFWMGS